jgi:hypothetical protein
VLRAGWLHCRLQNTTPSEFRAPSVELTVKDSHGRVHLRVAPSPHNMPGTGLALHAALPRRRDDELAIDLAFRVESHADPTAAKQALEQQIRSALDGRYEFWRAAELVMAGLSVGVHTRL